MNDTKAINRIKADMLRQLMEMKLPEHRPVPVVEPEPEEEPVDKWEEYEAEYRDNSDYNEDEERYLRERDEEYRRKQEEEIERMISATEDAREYLKAIEEFNANPSDTVTAGWSSTGDDL